MTSRNNIVPIPLICSTVKFAPATPNDTKRLDTNPKKATICVLLSQGILGSNSSAMHIPLSTIFFRPLVIYKFVCPLIRQEVAVDHRPDIIHRPCEERLAEKLIGSQDAYLSHSDPRLPCPIAAAITDAVLSESELPKYRRIGAGQAYHGETGLA